MAKFRCPGCGAETLPIHEPIGGRPHCARCDQDAEPADRDAHYQVYRAAKGFHGIIDHPSVFLIGEAGKENVRITPIKSKKNKGKHHDALAPMHFNMENFAPTNKKIPPGFNLDEIHFPGF